MKEIKEISEGKNFKAVDFGKFSELCDYVLAMGDFKLPGTVFGGQSLGTKGSEFSFQIYAPGQEGGFYHSHKNHEELYFVLSGKGEYQVDGQNIPLQQGTIVRVSPEGKRAIHNNGTEPMVVLCVQYRETPFTQEDAQDANMFKEPVKW